MNYNYEETKENKSLNNNKYIKNNIILNDYILLKKSYSELRNDYLSNKRNTDNILSQKNKSENELLKLKQYIRDLNSQIINTEEIIEQRNNKINQIKIYNKALNQKIEELRKQLDEIKKEYNTAIYYK